MFLNNMRISTKSIIPVAIVTAFTLLITWLGASSGEEINLANNNALYAAQRVSKAEEISANTLGIGRLRYLAIADTQEVNLIAARDQVRERTAAISKSIKELSASIEALIPQTSPTEKSNLQKEKSFLAISAAHGQSTNVRSRPRPFLFLIRSSKT